MLQNRLIMFTALLLASAAATSQNEIPGDTSFNPQHAWGNIVVPTMVRSNSKLHGGVFR